MTVVAPPASVMPETVITCPAVPTVPMVAEVQPIAFVVTNSGPGVSPAEQERYAALGDPIAAAVLSRLVTSGG